MQAQHGVHGRLPRLVSTLFSAPSALPDAACVRFSRHDCHWKILRFDIGATHIAINGLKGLEDKLARQHGRLFNVSKRTQKIRMEGPRPPACPNCFRPMASSKDTGIMKATRKSAPMRSAATIATCTGGTRRLRDVQERAMIPAVIGCPRQTALRHDFTSNSPLISIAWPRGRFTCPTADRA